MGILNWSIMTINLSFRGDVKLLIYLDSMAPAGCIERVVSKHIVFFSKNTTVTLLTKDTKTSFYDLPFDLEIKSLNVNCDFNMKNKLQRIYQTIKQIIKTRGKLKNHNSDYDLIYCTHVRNLLELYVSGIDLNKVIITEHGSYYGYNKIYKILKKILYPKCKYVVSPTVMDYEIYKSQNCNAFYIPNPLSFYNNNLSTLNNRTIINIGRLTSDKRQDLLLKIWREVSEKHPDWKLKIVGTGELKNELIQTIKNFNLVNSVKVIEPIKDVESLFLNSSIFTFTSRYEGFGMVLAEAMACGVPCISFDIPSGPRDIIENNIDGFLIEDNNIRQYINKLDLLMSDTNKRLYMGKMARENVKIFLDYKIEKKWNSLLKLGVA